MKKTVRISFVLIVGICFWFGISENYLSKHHSLFTQYDIENQQSSSDKDAPQNLFSFDEVENHFDKQIDTLFPYFCKNSSAKEFILLNEQILSAFSVSIWQPPKIS
jgi:hypothetical protein